MAYNRSNVLKKIFRPAVPKEHPGERYVPATPHAMWRSITPSPTFSSHPPSDITDWMPAAACGRVISIRSFPYNSSEEYLMMSLRPDVLRLPPHPGVRPRELDEFNHPWYVTADGSLGPYDPLRYPQDFRPETPWTGFHLYSYEFDQLLFRSAVDFFYWDTVSIKDMSGGHWNIPLISELLQRRSAAEAELTGELQHFKDPQGSMLYRHYGPSLPFYDEVELDDCRSWVRWDDGRDAIGRTLRYIGELDAIRFWLLEIRRQFHSWDREDRQARPNPMYAGIWVGGVNSDEVWRFLRNSPLSIYGLFPLDKLHPLRQEAVKGSLDNDEHFRFDRFLRALVEHAKGTHLIYPPDHPMYDHGYNPRPVNRRPSLIGDRVHIHLNKDLEFFPPKDRITNHTHMPSFDPRLPYNTYLYMEQAIVRNAPTLRQAEKEAYNHLKRYLTLTARPFRPQPPESNGATREMPYHPAIHVIPKRTREMGNRLRVFEEENDEGYWYVKELSESYRKKYRGHIRFPEEHKITEYDKLVSYSPWPLVGDIHEGHFNKDNNLPLPAPAAGKRIYITEKEAKILEQLQSNKIHNIRLRNLPPVAVDLATQTQTPTSNKISTPSTSEVRTPHHSSTNPCEWDSDHDEDLEPITTRDPRGRKNARLERTLMPIPVARRDQQSKRIVRSEGSPGVYILQEYVRECGIWEPGLWQAPQSSAPEDSDHELLELERYIPNRANEGNRRRSGRSRSPQTRHLPVRSVVSLESPGTDHISNGRRTSWQIPNAMQLVVNRHPPSNQSVGANEFPGPVQVADCLVPEDIVMVDNTSTVQSTSNMASSTGNSVPTFSQPIMTLEPTLQPARTSDVLSVPQFVPSGSPPENLPAPAHPQLPMTSQHICRPSRAEHIPCVSQAVPSTSLCTGIPAPASAPLSVTPASTPQSTTSMSNAFTSASSPTRIISHLPAPSNMSTTMPLTVTANFDLWISRLRDQRLHSQAYIEYRLNQSVQPPSFIKPPEVQYSILKLGSKTQCYLLRISNVELPESAPQEVARIMLAIARQEQWGEIGAISVHIEVDDTVSVDIGFRFLEDAITTWAREGKLHLGRAWHMAPVSNITGHCFVPRSFVTVNKSLDDRIHQLKICEALEIRLGNGQPAGPRLTQIQCLLRHLRSPILPLIPLTALESECKSLFLDGRDHAGRELDTTNINLDRGWIHNYSQAKDWETNPVFGALPGGIFFYHIIGYSPPELAERTKAAIDHTRKRQRQTHELTMKPVEERENTVLTELEQAKRSTWRQAQIKSKAWTSDALPLPRLPPKNAKNTVVDELLTVWNWYEECLSTVRLTFDRLGYGVLPPIFDDSSSGYERMESLRAAERSFGPSRRLYKVPASIVNEFFTRMGQNASPLNEGEAGEAGINTNDPSDNGDIKDDWELLSGSTESSWTGLDWQ